MSTVEAKKSVPHLKVLVSLVISLNRAQETDFVCSSRSFIHSILTDITPDSVETQDAIILI